MLSVQRVKELIGNANMPDEEAAEIRDLLRQWAELMLENYREQKRKERKVSNEAKPSGL